MRAKRIEDLTWKEVQQIDVGAFRGEEFKGQRVVSLVRFARRYEMTQSVRC
jgi:hypothetical protein